MEINVGKGITIDVNVTQLFPAMGWEDDTPGSTGDSVMRTNPVAGHVFYIGLRNILMDAHAGISTDEPDYQAKARAVVEKKLAAMYAGEVRVAGTREGDPVRAEAIRLATIAIKAMIKKAGRKNVDPKDMRKAALQYLEKNAASLMETAKARVEQAKAAIADDADLADLGL